MQNAKALLQVQRSDSRQVTSMAHLLTHAFRRQGPHTRCLHACQSSATPLGCSRIKFCLVLAVHGARASACLPHRSMHPELARWLEVCQFMRMPTLFLMSSSSAARMMARLAVTCSLIAEIKASSPVPDISSVITPPLHGHAHRQVTSQACLEHSSPSPAGCCVPVVTTLGSSIDCAAHLQL